MGGASDAKRGVMFNAATSETPAPEPKRDWKFWRRWGGRGQDAPNENLDMGTGTPRRMETGNGMPGAGNRKLEAGNGGVPAPFVIAEPEPESISFLKSLPNERARADAMAAVRRLFDDSVPALEEAKAALACDAGGRAEEIADRRIMLFAIAFTSKKDHMMEKGGLEAPETTNVFYFRIDLFTNLMAMLMREGEENGLRSKCDDRMEMLQAMGKMLQAMPPGERMDAFALMAGIAMKMGDVKKAGEGLCTKEVCTRMASILGVMAAEEGDKLGMLATMHKNALEHGFRPSGRNMDSIVPRAERDEAGRWIAGRPQGGVMDAAALAWERNKPKSFLEFMRVLEEEPTDTDNRRLHVLEEAVGEWAGGTCREYQPSKIDERKAISWNVAYLCVADIKAVADLAKGMPNEEQVRLDVLDRMLWVARRMPPGKRMEAPGLMAGAVRNLINGDVQLGLKPHHKEWVVTAWLDELCTYMNQPDANIAYERLRWLPMYPMKVMDYVEPAEPAAKK